MSRFGDVPANINFPKEEQRTLERWKANDTFRKSLELAKGRPHFTFYDGPPFATGLPDYEHILSWTIKDLVTRWAQQTGHYVERRFGWDLHGLTVEFEIDKKLGIKGPQDVYKMGIAKYNAECRSIVMRYANEWQMTVERMGRWIDFDNDDKTPNSKFMESVWWVFSELYKKGFVYRGIQIKPYCTSCAIPLSNFEANQNCQNVVDPGAYVAFELVKTPNRFMVIYTTTPWTLPSNLAIAVHPDLKYVVAKCEKTGKQFVLLEKQAATIFSGRRSYKSVEKQKGISFVGLEYTPLFPYFEHLKGTQAFHVISDTLITADHKTGVVHQAPYFGEIDYATCVQHGVIQKDAKEMVCPVDKNGCFTAEVTDYAGVYVKKADEKILKRLRDSGLLVKQKDESHSYPFCWRSNTPLLYKAVPSWFIRVESMVDNLLENNKKTNWVSSSVKKKHFHEGLRDARDWAVSRNRFWGTPINLWVSEDFSEVVCPASIAELEELSGAKITDLHREFVDPLEIKSRTTGKMLHRVSEVFDCWFESGSMPYAQQHYPFENRDHFESNFPADFISEGIDQTRGWFYPLLVVSTALCNEPPSKTLICNGLVLAKDGEKMSKSKKNYLDLMKVVHKYGADALRLYLINSPVVCGEDFCFREEGVDKLLKEVMLPWFNAFRILLDNINLYESEIKIKIVFDAVKPANVMDKWIISFTNSLIQHVRKEMAEYHLYAVVSPLARYFDTLTNVYIRFNRQRFKSDNAEPDRLAALSVMTHVLLLIVKLMAPFTPFFCDYLWQTLRKIVDAPEASVHFTLIPEPNGQLIDEEVERRVAAMRQVVDLGRSIREKKEISYPLKEIVVVNQDQQFLDDVDSLKQYLLLELNVKKLVVSKEKCNSDKSTSSETWESLVEENIVVLINTTKQQPSVFELLGINSVVSTFVDYGRRAVNTVTSARWYAAPVSPEECAHSFLYYYYVYLVRGGLDLLLESYYRETSIVSRFGRGPVSGLSNIRRLLNERNVGFVQVRVWKLEAHELEDSSVVFVATGEFVLPTAKTHGFIHHGVLSNITVCRYFVRTDTIDSLYNYCPQFEIPPFDPVNNPRWKDSITRVVIFESDDTNKKRTLQLVTEVSSSTDQLQTSEASCESSQIVETDPRFVQQAKDCFDEGKLKGFEKDIDYFMETLNSANATADLKCLSMINLTKKCAIFEFRKYLRSKLPIFQKLIAALKDCHETPALSICVASFLYMMARDAAQFPSIGAPLRLIYEFLKQERIVGDSEFQKYQKMSWDIVSNWKKDCEKRKQRRIIFDLTEKNLTPAYVALVTLDYIVARSPTKNQALQAELLNTGILQSLVAKVDKLVLSMKMLRSPTEETLRQHLSELEHSFRIFENGIMLDKRNQTFVVGHRQGLLLFSCEKYLDYFCNEVPNHEIGEHVAKQLFDCLSLMIRATMNASHSNEVCAIKLGKIGNFLSNSLHVMSSIVPRFAEKEKLFDLTLLLCGLLVNLTEKSPANRRKVSNMRCEFYDSMLVQPEEVVDEKKQSNGDSKHSTSDSSQSSSTRSKTQSKSTKTETEKRQCTGPEELPALEMLARLFVRHESQARLVDDELDNEMFEEVLENAETNGADGSGDENGAENPKDDSPSSNGAGRLTCAPDLSKNKIVLTFNSAMKKATSHMQDSMIASYVALLIGCLVQTDESMGDKLRALLPAGNFGPLLEQLERFREFAVLTKIVDVRCIEAIIDSLKILDH